MKKFLQGIFMGFALILPGLSGGTAFIILGLYRQILLDLATFNLKPYITFAAGTAAGLLFWAHSLHHLLNVWPQVIYSFLLGALWASAPLILRINKCTFSKKRSVYLIWGTVLGWIIAIEPLAVLPLGEYTSNVVIFLAGIVSSATMLIPGISGSAVLIIMGVYRDILDFLRNLDWLPLLIFAAGCIIGLFGLARIIALVFQRYKGFFSFFTAGMILGSGRTLFPAELHISVILAAAAGALIVTIWGGNNKDGR